MAKKNVKKFSKGKNSTLRFIIGMMIYAVIFLVAVGFGMAMFWNYMEAYEASRPSVAIDAYMEQLTPEHIVDSSSDLIDLVDHSIQSEEECRLVLLEAVSGDLTYARKASECTDTKQVYMIRIGRQVIGSFIIEAAEPDKYNFTPWKFVSESFDLSFLLTFENFKVTVPEGYPVTVNGITLDDSYVTDEVSEKFEVLKDYYKDYDLPMFVLKTYETGPFLGEVTLEVVDLEGNPFEYDPETFDPNVLINNCSANEESKLDTFMKEFLKRYVVFTGCANDAREANYARVIELVVKGSNLAKRMYDAIDGLQFAQSKGDEIASIVINHRVKLEEGCYLVDVTYLVNTTGREGVVQTTNNARIIVVEENGKFLVESLIIY